MHYIIWGNRVEILLGKVIAVRGLHKRDKLRGYEIVAADRKAMP
ncbi:hypothetical protein [Lewinella sp. W8]|nr:hypothetical protein [Lewinella sp. W8]